MTRTKLSGLEVRPSAWNLIMGDFETYEINQAARTPKSQD